VVMAGDDYPAHVYIVDLVDLVMWAEYQLPIETKWTPIVIYVLAASKRFSLRQRIRSSYERGACCLLSLFDQPTSHRFSFVQSECGSSGAAWFRGESIFESTETLRLCPKVVSCRCHANCDEWRQMTIKAEKRR
jgi:hypothetical protein